MEHDDKTRYIARPQSFSFRIWPYPVELLVSINQTDDQAKKALIKFNEPEDLVEKAIIKSDRVDKLAYVYKFKDAAMLLRVFHYNDFSATDRGTLAHEIFHVVDGLVEIIGAQLTEGAEEFWAYLIGWITTEIISKIKWEDNGD